MHSRPALALLLLVPLLCAFGQEARQAPPVINEERPEFHQAPNHDLQRFQNVGFAGSTQTSGEQLGVTIDTILEHHILPPAPQELAALAARILHPNISPAEIRACWKLDTPEEISAFLRGFNTEDGGNLWSWQGTHIRSLATKIPDTDVVWGGNHLAALGRTYVGLGIHLGHSGGFPMVMNPAPSGPAFAAGLRNNDLIVEIDGVSTKNQPNDTIIKQLRDRHGTAVTLRIRRLDRTSGEQTEQDITITRDVIDFQRPPTTKRSEEGLTYTVITFAEEIHESAFEELRQLERELDDPNVKTIVLDLRSVNHCSPQHAIQLADLLTPTAGVPLGRAVTIKGERQLYSTGNAVLANKDIVLRTGSKCASVLHWVSLVTPTRNFKEITVAEPRWLATEIVPIGSTRLALRLPTTQFFGPEPARRTTRVVDEHGVLNINHPRPPAEWIIEERIKALGNPGPQGATKTRWIVEDGVVVGSITEVDDAAPKKYTYHVIPAREMDDAEAKEYTYPAEPSREDIIAWPFEKRLQYYAEHLDIPGKPDRPPAAPLVRVPPE